MLISIRDVPLYERHLLFCSQLERAKHIRPHGRRDHNAPVVNRALSVCHGQGAEEDLLQAAIRFSSELVVCVPQALRRPAAALACGWFAEPGRT